MKLDTFRINSMEQPGITMDEAIAQARKSVLESKLPVSLWVRNMVGRFILLATYAPVSKTAWKYKTESGERIPVVNVQLTTAGRPEKPVHRLEAVYEKDRKGEDSFRLLIDGEPDPCNRVF